MAQFVAHFAAGVLMPGQPFPGVITTIAAQAKTRRHLGERANVFIDGKYSFALDIRLIEKHDLRRGMVVSEQFLAQLLQEDGDAKAYARALYFLSYRARSIHEVRARLKRDDWPDEVIARVLARLQAEKLLSDENFSTAWVEHRTLSRKPRGAQALRQELRQKGVAKETIDEALPGAEEELENAVVAARGILSGKARAWSTLEAREKQQKLFAAMQRRGFGFSAAKAAWQRLQEEEQEAI
jgi:regulatory protein